MDAVRWLTPDWLAPARVCAASTLRMGGVSLGPYASLNLGVHVGDDLEHVTENRRRVREALALPNEPVWLEQVHGTDVTNIDTSNITRADAAVSFTPGKVCVVMAADCLPVLFCSRNGDRVGVAHAGWRGLVSGVLERTVQALDVAPTGLMAWLGPAIEAEAFEVGSEVRDAFLARDTAAAAAFTVNARGRFQADLYQLARLALTRAGVTDVYGGGWRTYQDESRFFSHRRAAPAGRMATLIWLDPGAG